MSVPAPSPEETRCNAAFDALMWALSRPGLVRDLPEPGPAVIAETLLDRECAAFSALDALTPVIARTGAALVPLEQAEHVFLGPDLTGADLDRLRGLRMGSDLHPEDGATVILPAQIGSGPRLRLSGPGVDGTVDIALEGVPEPLWALRKAMMRYPMGFDLLILDLTLDSNLGGARVLGIPRSTHVEVL